MSVVGVVERPVEMNEKTIGLFGPSETVHSTHAHVVLATHRRWALLS